MIDIIEKDGATIITIQNPTPCETSVIERAKQVRKFAISGVWAKFKCNSPAENSKDNLPAETKRPAPAVSGTKGVPISDVTDEELKDFIVVGNLDDFEEIISDCDIDPEDLPF